MEPEKEKDETRSKRKEEIIDKILDERLDKLASDARRFDRAIDEHDSNPRRLSILVNARSKIHRELILCISLMRNPKLSAIDDSGRIKDLAKLIKDVVFDENSEAMRLVEEADRKDRSKAERNENNKEEN